jgi:hypothetical protein
MTNIDYKFLQEHIIEFMSVIEKCLHSTSYANDRSVYTKDIARAASWLIKLHKGIFPLEVAQEIIDPKTDKDLGDYWRQGEWGDYEAKALKSLQEQIRKHFSL